MMKTTVVSGGRYNAFMMARILQRTGCLTKLVTGYLRTPQSELYPQYVTWIPLPMAIGRLAQKVAPRHGWDYYLTRWFGAWASRFLGDSDIVLAMSSFGVESIRRAHISGAKAVVFRASTHILFQQELLTKEYQDAGYPMAPIDERIIARELWEYENADKIFVASQYEHNSFVSKGILPDKIVKLGPCAAETFGWAYEPKHDDTFRILFVGAGNLRKGIRHLFVAMEQLGRFRDWEWVVIGPIADEVRPFLPTGDENRIKWIASVRHSDLPHYYSQASVLVVPSIEDGGPQTAIEAMVMGVPVIITRNCGASELVEDGVNGFVVDAGDAFAISRSLQHLYQDPDLLSSMRRRATLRIPQVAGLVSEREWGKDFIRALSRTVLPEGL